MSFKWAYHAKVMNTFEQISRSVVWSSTGMALSGEDSRGFLHVRHVYDRRA